MKSLFFILFLLFFIKVNTLYSTDTLRVVQYYQGKSIYMQNGSAGKSNCTRKVLVNGEIVLNEVFSSAYEIDLSHLQIGDEVVIEIIHRSECEPYVLCHPFEHEKIDFKFVSVSVEDSNLVWKTRNKGDKGTFFIEMLKKNDISIIQEIKVSETDYNILLLKKPGEYRVRYENNKGFHYLSKWVRNY